jgi:predicted secreted protein
MTNTSKPFAPVGLTLGYSTEASTSAYTLVGQLTSLSGPTQSKETIDVTSFDSKGGYREFIDGFKDGGEISCDMNFTAAAFQEMQTLFNMNDDIHWKISLPNAEKTEITFDGKLTSNQMSASVGDKVSASITIKVSGAVTITDTATA